MRPDTDGTAVVELRLSEDEPPQALDARFAWIDRAVLATVRVQW